MKRAIAVAVALLFCLSIAQAAEVSRSSGLKTSSAAIATTGGTLSGVLVTTDGTNAATITVYDHASSASGTILFTCTVVGGAYFGGATWEKPIRYSNGIYAAISGTGASYIIYNARD